MNLTAVAETAYNLVTVLGATASGKTRLAVALARELEGEIISADSRQVFRGMDIGTGKDLHEYGVVPYHLIDCCAAGQEFSLFEFLRRFNDAYDGICSRRRLPIMCGGTGLYLDAVLRGYAMVEAPCNQALREELADKDDLQLVELLQSLKPQQHNTTDLLERSRTVRAIEIAHAERQCGVLSPPHGLKPLVFGIRWEREALKQRIAMRLMQRLECGMVDEVQRLHQQGVGWERLDYYGLEYRWIGRYLQGLVDYGQMVAGLNAAIHSFSKQQVKWFRRLERHGIVIQWLEGGDDTFQQALAMIALLKKH